MAASELIPNLPPMRIKIEREIPLPWFTLKLEDGSTEELEPEDAREWFRLRGADMVQVNKAMDFIWNFGMYKPVYVVINKPKLYRPLDSRIAPNI